MVKEVKIDKMDELIEALGGGGGGSLPTPTVADNGKVLGVENGAYALKDDEGVDMSAAQVGQVLTAIADMQGNVIQGWTTPDEGLPVMSSSDNGKVLQAVYNDKSGETTAQWVGIPIIKKLTITSAGVTYDDKSGNAYMSLPSGSVFINICFKGNSDAIYPVEILYYDNYGNIYISSTEYQRIVDEPDGNFIVCYY